MRHIRLSSHNFKQYVIPTTKSDTSKLIGWNDVVFIEDTREIWTHGVIYNCSPDVVSFNPENRNWNGNWFFYGFPNTISDGSYVVQVSCNGVIYTGYCSYTSVTTREEEILLHSSGDSNYRVFLKLGSEKVNDTDEFPTVGFKIAVVDINNPSNNVYNVGLSIKMKKLL